MNIDLGILWQIALLVLGGAVTWAVQRAFDRQARLVTYYGHTSIHHVSTDKPVTVHTHSLVIRNTGRAAATNVRVSHRIHPLNVYVDPPDQGFAKAVSVIPQQQAGRRTILLLGLLVIVGAITTLYLIWYGSSLLARQMGWHA